MLNNRLVMLNRAMRNNRLRANRGIKRWAGWPQRQIYYGAIALITCGMLLLWQMLTPAPLQALHAPTLPSALQEAQALNRQGEQQFQQNHTEAALERWQQAEAQYRRAQDEMGVWGTQINQAKALQALGFYRRAKSLLEDVTQQLDSQPDSALKTNAALTLGNILRLVGEFRQSQAILDAGLAMAQRLQSAPHIQAAHLYLGNTLFAQQMPAALEQYQQAAAIDAPLQLTAQLRQLSLPQLDAAQAAPLLQQIETQLQRLPPSPLSIYGQIELARWLLRPPASPDLSPDLSSSLPPDWPKAPELLNTAIQQARVLGDRRAESYAVGSLAHWHEQQKQTAEAQRLTQSALKLAAAAPDIAYQWQWQLGRILVAQNNVPGAIAAYTAAVDLLQSLRGDLMAVGQDVQFSFREQVEPVYRQLVGLLLQSASGEDAQKNLREARQVIEALQIAELNNFLREACLESALQQVDQIDPTAAVLYPIILPDRLEIILSRPNQPLRHYSTALPQAEIEAGIHRMLQSLRVTSFPQERLPAAQQLYQWLVQPAIADLQAEEIKTLVFVADGVLRNVPMAALHDGQHYLIEQYQIATAPGLQLLRPSSLQADQTQVLVGALSEGLANFAPLPGVLQEVSQISSQVPAYVLLNQAFTTKSLEKEADRRSFTVLHLATHGQFSATVENTFIQTWDGRLTIRDLQALLQRQEDKRQQSAAIDLLVLSACQTAQGDDRAILGMAGMAIQSGAQSTLATLWAVNDQSTAAFVTTFYQALAQPGITKAEAVRQAQLQLLHQTQYHHPYYWAPFILVGDWL